MTAFDLIRIAHVSAGSVALGSFWIPLVVQKGGPAHRRAGWTYAVSMWISAVMSLLLCTLRLLDDDASNDGKAIFLAFVALLAANGSITGIRILKTKSRVTAHRNVFDLGISALLLVSSIGLAVYGRSVGATLFVSFSVLGMFLSVGQLRFWMRAPATPMEWWLKHMGSMLAACIATVTAFVVVNASRFGMTEYQLVFWLGPGVIGGTAIALWQRHYQRKWSHVRSPAP